MKKYLEEVKNQIGSLKVKFIQIPREENECANRLAKAASAEFMIAPEQVLSFVQTSSLIDDGVNVQETNSEKNLDHAIDSIPEVRHSANRKRSCEEVKYKPHDLW